MDEGHALAEKISPLVQSGCKYSALTDRSKKDRLLQGINLKIPKVTLR
jgi:hypothetical protein